MEGRLVLAYSLLLVLALSGAAIAFYLWYNGRDRSIARQRQRNRVRHERRAHEKPAAPGD